MAAPSGITFREVEDVDIPLPVSGKFTVYGRGSLPRVKDSMGNIFVLGNGIVSIAFVSATGLVDNYLITLQDGTEIPFTVTNAKSITTIAKIGTTGVVDTYRISFNNGAPVDFTVTNARSIVDIQPPQNPGQPGATDTYQIVFNDGPNDTFIVYNGTNGLDGQGQPAQNNPTTIDPDDAASIGTRTAFYALEDHQHAITAAAATGLAGNSTNTEGTAASFARSDHTHAISNGGTPSTLSNTTATQGTSTSLARADHVHAVSSAAAVSLNGGSTNTAGTATTLALSDHTHAISNGGTPSTITPDAAANQGASTSLARSDHTHAIAADVPVALGTQPQEGTSNSFSRADHVHLNPVIAHEAAGDPHPQYTTTAEAAAAAPVQSIVAGTGITVSGSTGNVTVNNAGVTSVSVNGGAAQTGAVSVTIPQKLSATITTLFASPANSTAVTVVLSLAIPSGYLTTGKSFDFDLEGTQSQSAAATNVVGAIFVNNTQLVSAAVAGGTAAQTNRSIRMKGGIMWNGANYLGNITTAISGVLPVGNANVTGVAVAAATAHNIDIRVQTSTANAANIIRAMVAAIKEI